RRPNHHASVVNAEGEARKVPGKHSEVPHTCLPAPDVSMKGRVAGQIRMTDHVTLIVDCTSVVPPEQTLRPAEVAEVRHRAVFFPEQGVRIQEIEPERWVEGCARARYADGLTVVVDPDGGSVRVAGVCRE